MVSINREVTDTFFNTSLSKTSIKISELPSFAGRASNGAYTLFRISFVFSRENCYSSATNNKNQTSREF